MIEFKTGNILDEEAEALVNTVNCVGIMGRGIALGFKTRFPENFKAYSSACKTEEVRPGRMFVFETGTLTNPGYIINFPTKRHWKGKSRFEDIESGLAALKEEVLSRKIRSLAVPPLGCGLGGLDWKKVRPRIEAALADLPDVKVIVFEPSAVAIDSKPNLSTNVPVMTPSRAILVGLIRRYLKGMMDPAITLLEIHKLMYFMQKAGQPLKLIFRKGHYGPYAENLRHALAPIEGHLISGFIPSGDDPKMQIGLVPGAVDDALSFLSDKQDALIRFDRVSKLVDGFESRFGLELLSTVHWLATRESAGTLPEIIAKTYDWNESKKQFTERQIGIAFDCLKRTNWI